MHGWLCQVHGVRYELNADVGEVLVGLCPARHDNVRLEWNPECPCLLHNYGHGGSCDFFMGLCYWSQCYGGSCFQKATDLSFKALTFFHLFCFRNLWAHFHLLVGDMSWISCVIGGYWMNRECYLCTVHFIYQRKTKLISLFKWNLCNTVWNSVRSKYWIKVIFGKLFIYLFCRMAGADPNKFHYDSNCQNWSTCNSCAQFQT